MAILSRTGRVAYFSVPKIACTSLKIFFWELEHGRRFEEQIVRRRLARLLGLSYPRNAIHQQSGFGSVPFNRTQFIPEDYARIVVVRDPLSRLRSAWSNKVRRDRFERNSEADMLRRNGLSLNPTLGELVDNWDRYRRLSRPARIHTELISTYTGADLAYYDRVFVIEQLAELEEYLAERIGRPITLPRKNETSRENRSFALTSTQVSRVREILKPDYDLLSRYYRLEDSLEKIGIEPT